MHGYRKKYQKDKDKNEVIETTTTTKTIVETKIEKPNTTKVVEQKVFLSKEPLSKNKYGRMYNQPGRASAIFSLKRDNDLIIKTHERQSSKDKDKKPSGGAISTKYKNNYGNPKYRWSVVEKNVEKEPIKWRRFNRIQNIEEEKPDNNIKVEKNVKEKTIEKSPNTINTTITKTTIIDRKDDKKEPEKKEIKTEITIEKTNNDNPEDNIENKKNKNDDKKNRNEKKYKSEDKNPKIIHKLKVSLNDIEKANKDRILKKNLVEIFEGILEQNLDFKDKIFFKNLIDTEKKVGNMDKKKISHTFREIETSEIIEKIQNADELAQKYTNRAKRIVEEN